MEKARILVLKGKNEGKEIPVLFNPTEYTLDKSNEFANINIPGLDSPLLQFTRGGLQTLTMDLFFDTYEKDEDVRNYTKKVIDLMEIDEKLHAPPVCKFIWGGGIEFICVISKISKKFTMFNSNGIPVRATLSVTFNEYKTETSVKERSLESRDRTKHYTLKQGDSLWLIAAKEYGEPTMWRAIAEANKIDNPRMLESGKAVIIPPLEE